MGYCVCERTTKLIESYTRYDHIDHDPTTHVEIEVEDKPDRKTKRWDGAFGFRDATAQELAAAATVKTAKEEAEFNFEGVLLTIAKAFHNHENRIRKTEGKAPVTLRQVIKKLRQL